MSRIGADNMLFGFHKTITNEQKDLLELILAPTEEVQIIFIDALAGTGKTQAAVMGAKLRQKKLRYIFAGGVNEDDLGYLPGEKFEKEAPYLTPLKQALTKIRDDASKINTLSGWVVAHSDTYERGVTYEDETVIIEEAQNYTMHKLRKIITRCSDSCKVIVIGNMKQCDLKDPSDSGFHPYYSHSFGERWTRRATLTHNFRGRLAQWADEI
jgi:predicted ribonuclease YlaK